VRGNEAVDEANIYPGRSLKGEKPAEAPVMRPTRFELAISLKTATALGPAVLSTPLAASN
jgi:putative ABC transport system substrate-binding protein